MSPRGPWALSALLVVLVVGVVSVRQVRDGGREITLADRASLRSDWPMAIAHARAAAQALAPASPWPERGWQRLEAIGHDAEARGDDETALLAYGAMRAAALSTRGPLSDWRARREQAEEGLARIAASARDPDARKLAASSMLDALRATEPPASWILVVLAVSAAAMVAGLGLLAWRGPQGPGARVAQALAAAGLLVYAAVSLTR